MSNNLTRDERIRTGYHHGLIFSITTYIANQKPPNTLENILIKQKVKSLLQDHRQKCYSYVYVYTDNANDKTLSKTFRNFHSYHPITIILRPNENMLFLKNN